MNRRVIAFTSEKVRVKKQGIALDIKQFGKKPMEQKRKDTRLAAKKREKLACHKMTSVLYTVMCFKMHRCYLSFGKVTGFLRSIRYFPFHPFRTTAEQLMDMYGRRADVVIFFASVLSDRPNANSYLSIIGIQMP